jgi:hypothetical protein
MWLFYYFITFVCLYCFIHFYSIVTISTSYKFVFCMDLWKKWLLNWKLLMSEVFLPYGHAKQQRFLLVFVYILYFLLPKLGWKFKICYYTVFVTHPTVTSVVKFCSPSIRRQRLSIVERHSNEASADNVVLNIPSVRNAASFITYLTSNRIAYHSNNAVT